MIAGELEIQLMADIARLKKDMDDAKAVVGGAMAAIDKSVEATKAALGMLGGIATAGMFAGLIRSSIDAADGLADLSKTANLAVETLSGLKWAAQLSGTDLDTAAKAVNKLAVEMGQNAEKFAKIGVTASEPLEAFKQLSDVFAQIQDPQLRAAFGAEALGKSWESLAPLLSEGGEKIGEMIERGKQLSGVTDEMVEKSGEFNDRVDEMRAILGGLTTRVSGDLLPLLNALTAEMLESANKTEGLTSSFNPLTETLRALIVIGGNVSYVLKGVGTEIGGIAAQISALARADFKGFAEIGQMMKKDAETARKEFDAWEKRIMEAGQKAAEPKPEVDPEIARQAAKAAAANAARVRAFVDGEKAAKAAADAAKKAAEAAQKELEEQAKMLAEIAGLSGSFAEEWNRLSRIYASGKLSTDDLVKAQADLLAKQPAVKKGIDAEKTAIEDLIKAQEELASDYAKDVADRLSAWNGALSGVNEYAKGIKESNALTEYEVSLLGQTEYARNVALGQYQVELALRREILKIQESGLSSAQQEMLIAKANAAAAEARAGIETKAFLEQWRKDSDEINRALTDSLMRGFEDGKGFARNFADTVENLFKTMILRPTIQGILAPIAGQITGAVTGQSSAGSMLNMAGTANTAYNMFNASSYMSRIAETGQMLGYGNYGSNLYEAGIAAYEGIGSAGAAYEASTQAAMAANGSAPALGGYIPVAVGGLTAYNVGQKYGALGGLAAGAGTVAAGGAITGAATADTLAGAGSGATAALGALGPWGWAAIAGLAILGGMQDGPEEHTTLQFASNNQAGNISINRRGNEGKDDAYIGPTANSAFGSFGVRETFWMDPRQPVVEAFVKSIESMDNAIAESLSTLEIEKVKNYVTGRQHTAETGAEGNDPSAGLTTVFLARVTDAIDAIDPVMHNFVAGFKGTADQMAVEVAGIFNVRKQLADDAANNNKLFGDLFGGGSVTMDTFNNSRREGESFTAAFNRLAMTFASTNEIARMLGQDTATAFGAVGVASYEARERLISLAGGIDALQSKTAFFTQNFLTEAEQMAPAIAEVERVMADLGHAGVDTKDEFKALVQGLDLSTESGAMLYAQLMNIAPAFLQVANFTELAAQKAAEKAIQIASQRSDLEIVIMELQGDAAGALAARRQIELNGMDESLRPLQQRIYALQDEASAAEVASQALADHNAFMAQVESKSVQRASETASIVDEQNRVWADFGTALTNAMQQAEESTRTFIDSINDFKASLLLDKQLSALSPEQQYVRAQSALINASGDDVQGAARAFLEASRAYYGSGENYVADFNMVLGRLDGAIFEAQQRLEGSYAFGARAAQMIYAAMGVDGSHADGLDRVPFDGYKAILHKDERVKTAAQARAEDAGKERTAEEIKANTQAVREQNALLETLIAEVRDGKQVSSDDMRSLKQHLTHAISKAVTA
jgi:hypothetical protein